MQHLRWDEREVNEKPGKIIRIAFREVAERSAREGVPLRIAPYEQGIEGMLAAARTRGYITDA